MSRKKKKAKAEARKSDKEKKDSGKKNDEKDKIRKYRRAFIGILGIIGLMAADLKTGVMRSLGSKIAGWISGGKDPEEIAEKLKEYMVDYEKEKKEYGYYLVKRKIGEVDRLLSNAEKEVQILGINSLGPLHQGRENLLKVLDNGGTVNVCMLDMEKDHFKERENYECSHNNKTSKRLSTEWQAAFEILRDIELHKKKGDLNFKVYDETPEFSIVIADNRELQYNPYPPKEDSKKKSVVDKRGLSGELQIIENAKDPVKFQTAKYLFDSMWRNARRIELDL
ncbi:MAG: hypothetical protein ACYS8W_12160 [Planctomycetota bacterium]|jgi:hypothetical protein